MSFFFMAYLVSWLCWTPYVLSRDGLDVLHFAVPRMFGDSQLIGILPGGYLGPLTSAFLVTALAEGREGLRRWRRRLFRWRVPLRWYLFALLGVPALLMVGTSAVPGAWGGRHVLPPAGVFAAYLPLLVLQTLTTGVAEEPGWRDFALPRLQHRLGPLRGTLTLAALWALWHAPLFLTTWSGHHTDPGVLLGYLATAVSISVVITWVFNRTGGSLPLAVLVHVGNNNVLSTVWPAAFPDLDPFRDGLVASAAGFGALAVVLVIATRGRLGLPRPREGARPSRAPQLI